MVKWPKFLRNLIVLRRIYIFLLILIVPLIIFTPLFINHRYFVFEEETAEVILTFLLLIVGYSIYRLYQKEVEKNERELKELREDKNDLESRLDEAFRHIGKVNVQIDEIRDVFSKIDKYPESREEIKHIFHYLAHKVLGLVDADWVLLKIVDLAGLTTKGEHYETRGGIQARAPKISNSDLLEKNSLDGWQVLKSEQRNLNIKAFCILPPEPISEDQKILIQAITGQLEMLFLIFSSLENGFAQGQKEL
jgi:DNA gyrase/topoisomerase IV subunit A